MKTKLMVGLLLAGSSLFAETRFSIGIGVGGNGYYPAPPPVVAYAPSPGPGYNWVDGYWDYAGPRRFWHGGYWAAPVYRAAPRYNNYRDRRQDFRDSRDHDRFENRFDRR
jgi:hypothetical protein